MPLSCFTRGAKTLQRHQLNLVYAFINSKRHGTIAIHDVGTGKTLAAVATSKCYLEKYPTHKVILISPASLIAGFQKELREFEPGSLSQYSFYTFDGFLKFSGRCTKALIIIDEGQNLRTVDSKKTKFILSKAVAAHKVLVLTATPMVNAAYDIEPLLSMVHAKMPFDRQTFATILKDKKLAKIYFGCMLSFHSNDASTTAKYFPAVKKIYVPIIMNDATESVYNSVEKNRSTKTVANLFDLENQEDKNLQSFYNGLRRVCVSAGGAKGSQKINFIIDFIQHVQMKQVSKALGITKRMLESHCSRFIIFTHFREHGEAMISARLKDAGIYFGVINGSVSKEKRAQLVDEYVGGRIKVIIISEAGAEGLNLLKTGYVFLVDPGWTESERTQVEARAVRYMSHTSLPSIKRNVLVMTLVLIKQREKKIFDDVVSDRKKYEKLEFMPSIDTKMIVDSKRKQKKINEALAFLKSSITTVEKCTDKKESERAVEKLIEEYGK
jgi:SNF2 family DNA or RNA helicase